MKKIKTIILTLSLLFVFSNSKLQACNANFTHTNSCAGDTVWFYALDQLAVYTWDFGDGGAATNINHDTATFHIYNSAGTYYVTLFVNVGAEWDYQTQIITIGTNCFTASYLYDCAGSNMMNFNSTSVGATSVSWDFGEPSSGASNVSILTNPSHTYASTGSYVVSLTASDGTSTNTSTQTINVSATCISATFYPNINGYCSGDTSIFNIYYTGTITSYNWNFGDPSSGINNFSTLSNPTHIFANPGSYNVRVIISNGSMNDTANIITNVRDCTCWAGDANDDGEVNCDDIFPIGIFYGGHAPVIRPAASNSYTSQPCPDWNGWNYFMYLQDLVNMKHADCNGDSTVNNSDLIAINLNYGLHHNAHNNVSGMPEANVNDPSMYLQVPAANASAGSTISVPIYLGTSTIPVANLYGYSLAITYDPALVVNGSVSLSFATNWLGNASNELSVSHDNYATGRIEGGVVKFDKIQVLGGYGQIATLTFTLQTAVSGNLHLGIASSAKALSANMYSSTSSSNQEIFHPINLIGGDIAVYDPMWVNSIEDENSICIFPNPAKDVVNILITNEEISEVSLINELGQTVYSNSENFKNKISINIEKFAKGIYTLSCKTKNGVTLRKVTIN